MMKAQLGLKLSPMISSFTCKTHWEKLVAFSRHDLFIQWVEDTKTKIQNKGLGYKMSC